MEGNPIPANAIKPKRQASIAEFFSYGFYFAGQNIIYFLVTSYLMFFYTEEAKISPATVAVIFGIAKVWDAINDPIFGFIVDKTRFKGGRFVPWIKISSFLLPLSTVLVFSIPGTLSVGLKILLAFLTYAIWDILYTVSDAPAFALSTVMTDNVQERSTLISVNRIGAMVGIFGVSILTPIMIEKAGMGKTSIILCIAAFVTMVPLGFVAKEKSKAAEEEVKDEATFKDMLEYLKGNKYLLYLNIANITNGIFGITLTSYVSVHLLGGLGIQSKIMIFIIPLMILTYVLLPFLTKRFDKMNMYKVSLMASIIARIITYFVGYQNENLYILMSVLSATILLFSGALIFTFSSDALEYGHYKTGLRKEGITFSLQTFSAKFTSAIAGVLTAIFLAIIGYKADITVTETMKSLMWAASCFVPVVGTLLSLPIFFKYKLTDKDVQVMSDINNGHISREEGEKRLSKEY